MTIEFFYIYIGLLKYCIKNLLLRQGLMYHYETTLYNHFTYGTFEGETESWLDMNIQLQSSLLRFSETQGKPASM